MFEVEDIIKSANIYLCAKDKNFKYIYCNENVARALNLESPKQIVGKTDYDLHADCIASVYRSGDIKVLKGSTLLNLHEIHPYMNKKIKILTTKNQLKNKSGSFVGVIVSFIDITDLASEFSSDIFQHNNKDIYKFYFGKESEYFTKREYDVFKNILIGLTAKEIAKKFSLSHRTVQDNIEKIKLKLQCTSKHHITEAAIRLGIVQQNILNDKCSCLKSCEVL